MHLYLNSAVTHNYITMRMRIFIPRKSPYDAVESGISCRPVGKPPPPPPALLGYPVFFLFTINLSHLCTNNRCIALDQPFIHVIGTSLKHYICMGLQKQAKIRGNSTLIIAHRNLCPFYACQTKYAFSMSSKQGIKVQILHS